jgi:hypothetical protein
VASAAAVEATVPTEKKNKAIIVSINTNKAIKLPF